MRQPPGESVQKLCPSCSTLAYTGDRRCPWCGSSDKRRIWAPLMALLLVQTALVLGGVAYMLTVLGDELDTTLDEQVTDVQRDLDESVEDVRRSVREELDRRLPEESAAP